MSAPAEPIVCVDVGSTFTKAAAVGPDGALLAVAQHPTTVASDVLAGLDAAVAALGLGSVPDSRILGCSSAGGGLRLAVVGQERVVSAEAGRRVALSAGARVVAVTAGPLAPTGVQSLTAARPDVVLLVGGTDGGAVEVLLHNAQVLGGLLSDTPVVVAGNRDAADAAAERVGGQGRIVRVASNVIPRIGTLAPGPARSAIREVFISHVIGGKGLSAGTRFASLVLGATPDVVLAGVEVVADVLARRPGASGDVLVVDVGGATTDVYSVLDPAGQSAGDVVEPAWHGRSVEGDLGMRWSAPDVLAAARAERLLIGADAVPAAVGGPVPPPARVDHLAEAARRRHDRVGLLPETPGEIAVDLELARFAALVAVRRHARPGPEGVRDLSRVTLLIGSGGVLRHAAPDAAAGVLTAVLGDRAGGWRLPVRAAATVDRDYLLAPIGLLSLAGRPAAATALAERLVGSVAAV